MNSSEFANLALVITCIALAVMASRSPDSAIFMAAALIIAAMPTRTGGCR